MQKNESTENYLETILILSHNSNTVRAIDVANHLSFSKPSVSIAMKNLKAQDYITVESSGNILLTSKGKALAECIYERHTLLTFWLTKLGVSPDTASEDACRIEHQISQESFEAIKKHIKQ